MICLVLLIQTLVYREISALFRSTNDPWSNTLNWYFLAVANYFLYGETIIYYFKVRRKLLLLVPAQLFFAACRLLGRSFPAICSESPVHQLYALHVWYVN